MLENVFNGESRKTLEQYDADTIKANLGLKGHISSQRLRGFSEAVRKMKK